ncbi:MAG: NAD(P)H-hydrate epimerase, partial [Clostridia bacterium]|nr:NAD(P)H-hydrate epimerase [Clostridia bacterium]
MKKILTSEQMRMCDTLTIESGVMSSRLMEKAAKAVAEVAVSSFDPTRTLAVCGGGNNGGDGVLTALLLSRAGYSCDIYFVGDRDRT